MTFRQPPVFLLDIDGVLNTFLDSWGVTLTRTRCAGQPIRYAPPLHLDAVEAFAALAVQA